LASTPGIPTVRIDAGESLATFAAATGLDIAPDGTVYVTDAGLDAIVVHYPDGRRRVEGGPGTDEGQFDSPADVDAGTGLVLHVADAGNRRVQRFSREFRRLGSVFVDITEFDGTLGIGDLTRGDRNESSSGRPIGVATSDEDDLFAVDESAGVVLKWNAALNPERVIGAFGSGDGQLVAPVSVATDGDRYVYVADAGRRALIAFDLFGAFIRRVPVPAGEVPVGLDVAATGRVLLATQRHVYGIDGGDIAFALAPEVGATLVDVAVHQGTLLVLTGNALYGVPLPASE
jgi:outer membrane protein assembly factor BamB